MISIRISAADYDAAVEFINEVRTELGVTRGRPVSKISDVLCGRPTQCPIARSIRHDDHVMPNEVGIIDNIYKRIRSCPRCVFRIIKAIDKSYSPLDGRPRKVHVVRGLR